MAMTAPGGAEITSVDFHFDIMCPWAYQASLWIRDVRDQLGLSVGWRFFSLEEINRADGSILIWSTAGTSPLAPPCTSTGASRTAGTSQLSCSVSLVSTQAWSTPRSTTPARARKSAPTMTG